MNFIKALLLWVFLCGLSLLHVNAQVTVNPGAGSYATLQLAFAAINNGTHAGAVTVSITGNTTETSSAVLNASGSGSASYTSVEIYPTVSGLTISGNLAVPLIDLNGADNVTIDGRVNASGSTIDMTITNTNFTNVTSTIRFTNDATTNTIKYCTLKGAPTQLSSIIPVSGIIHIGTSGAGSGNDDNVISNNNITNSGTRLQCAIFAKGTVGKENSGVIIRENNIYDILTNNNINGSIVFISTANTDFQITANSFYETTSWNPLNTTYYVINIDNTSGNNFNVSNNYVGGSASLCGGSAWSKGNGGYDNFMCIYMNVGTTTASNIQGNTITNWNYNNSGSTKSWYGINVAGGSVNIGTTTANTIGAGSSTDAITVTKSHFYGIYLAGSGVLDIQNNTIGSITNTTLTYSTYGIYAASTSGTLTIKNNTIGSTSSANSIYSSSTTNTGIWGINVTSTGTTAISGNTLANISNNATSATSLTGIRYSGSSNTASISGNFLRGISYTNAANTATLTGIDLVAGTNSTYNNIISLGNGNPGIIYGIATAGGTNNIYFNTVYLSGTPTSGAYNSAALYSSAANTRNIRNNIFSNARSNSGATGNHYAAYFGAAGTGLTIDYNDYFVSGSGGLLGYYNSTSINTLPDWRTATTMDVRSRSVNPSLSSAGGASASNYLPSETTLVAASGTGITADFLAVSRNVSAPSMGAIEYTVNGCLDPLSGGTIGTSQSICQGVTAALTTTSLPAGQLGTLEYKWQYSTTDASSGFADITSSNAATYTSGALTVNTWFKRLARVSCSSDWSGAGVSNVILVTVKTDPGLSNFSAVTRIYFDGTYTITPPSTGSDGAITYTSSNTDVATISGSTVTIVSAGTSTITATQAATATYCDVSISALLTVNSVQVVTKSGQISATNTNYVNKNGSLNSTRGLSKTGEIKITETCNCLTIPIIHQCVESIFQSLFFNIRTS